MAVEKAVAETIIDETDYSGSEISFMPGLFNTRLSDTLDDELRSGIADQKQHIDATNVRYLVPFSKMPKMFDTRYIDKVPPDDVGKWFFKNYKGDWTTILAIPLDQAGCGSCWAFSTSTQYSDVVRFNLLQRYSDKACVSSIFFHPMFVCTGDSEITKADKGVVNPGKVTVYAQEAKMQISTYFTVAFSPKIGQVGGKTVIDKKCNDALKEWRETITTRGRTAKLLAKDYASCMGCGGNLIICPLMLFTGSNEAPGTASGAPLLIDFPLHEWACLWGDQSIRNTFCSPDFLTGEETFEFPDLYKADAYSYIEERDFAKKRPPGVKTMTECMMLAIYNYGPITIGFSVYQAWMRFFSVPGNAKKIYTAQDFIKSYQTKAEKPLGGHAVVITGWGTETPEGSDSSAGPVDYWVVRNSWGVKWADQGYFRIERNIDAKLAAEKINEKFRFESEFGSLYFAPSPNPELYDTVEGLPKKNEMKDFLLVVPAARCPAINDNKEALESVNRNCKCRCGYAYDPNSTAPNGCEKVVMSNKYKLDVPDVQVPHNGENHNEDGSVSPPELKMAGAKSWAGAGAGVDTTGMMVDKIHPACITPFNPVVEAKWKKYLPILLLLLLTAMSLFLLFAPHQKKSKYFPPLTPYRGTCDQHIKNRYQKILANSSF